MAALSGHFLDVMRGLPTLVALPPGPRAVRDGSARSPTATGGRSLDTLRLAFASSAVLELVATLSRRAGRGHRGRPAGRRRTSTCAPRWSCCCSRRRPTGRCAGSARSSTPPPRGWRPSRPSTRSDVRRGVRRRRRRPAAGSATWSLDRRHASRYPGRTRAGRRRTSTRVLPGTRRHRGHRAVRLRQVHAARRRSPGCCRRPAARSPSAARPSAGPPGGRQVAWLPAAPLFVAGTRRRQPPARPPRRDRRRSCGRRCAGSPSRSGSATCPAASTHPSARTAATLSAGERARLALARVVRGRPALGAARRAHRPPRRR